MYVRAMSSSSVVLVLAAGLGTRMKSDLAKVLHPVAGRPLVVWAVRVAPEMSAMMTQSAHGSVRMVRASLVKSDALMRSLGRPNRDQIVSMRPSDLTTLEAIDLANGQTLADDLAKGARNILTRQSESTGPLGE